METPKMVVLSEATRRTDQAGGCCRFSIADLTDGVRCWTRRCRSVRDQVNGSESRCGTKLAVGKDVSRYRSCSE